MKGENDEGKIDRWNDGYGLNICTIYQKDIQDVPKNVHCEKTGIFFLQFLRKKLFTRKFDRKCKNLKIWIIFKFLHFSMENNLII